MTEPPRLPPLAPDKAPERVRAILREWPYNLHKTLAHSPEMMTAWMGFAEHVLRRSSLSARDREIVILRIAWNTRSAYEWGMHAMVARRVGMDEADLAAAVQGPAATHWSGHERALVQAVDEIMAGWRVCNETWAMLAETYTHEQLVDLMMLIGEFLLVALTLNVLQIAPEPGLDGLPDQAETDKD